MNSNGATSLSFSVSGLLKFFFILTIFLLFFSYVFQLDHEADLHVDTSHFSVTAVLARCKTKILRPYLHFLCAMGLRPMYTDQIDNCSCLEFCSYLYTSIVICLLILGYILQFMACFTRDRGFFYLAEDNYQIVGSATNEDDRQLICNGSAIFSYIIPNAIHLIAYFYAVLVFRTSDDDQLTSLMERVSEKANLW